MRNWIAKRKNKCWEFDYWNPYKDPTIYTILTDTAGFDQALLRGIKAYSKYIKWDQLVPASNTVRYIQQNFNNQFNWGILQYH